MRRQGAGHATPGTTFARLYAGHVVTPCTSMRPGAASSALPGWSSTVGHSPGCRATAADWHERTASRPITRRRRFPRRTPPLRPAASPTGRDRSCGRRRAGIPRGRLDDLDVEGTGKRHGAVAAAHRLDVDRTELRQQVRRCRSGHPRDGSRVTEIGGARSVVTECIFDMRDQLARTLLVALGKPLARSVPRVAHRAGAEHSIGGNLVLGCAKRRRQRIGFGRTVQLHHRTRSTLREQDTGGILHSRAEPPDPIVAVECAASGWYAHFVYLSWKSQRSPTRLGRESVTRRSTVPRHPFGRRFSGSMNT